MMTNLKYIYVKPSVLHRNNHTYDAVVYVEIIDYTSSDKPEILHKYIRVGYSSVKDAEAFAYAEAIKVQDVMITSAREYLKKYKDVQ